ncbi:MMPL family transporter [Microbacterium sp. SORGH_AS_0888]|uniref:MMPL family transporter n=1 Tax=Microbacterium sp. SORGH_AS_0888 TaxID=3041791 RepID=UPI0027806F16|nr:MMPL family transporter [Microbacterium sp. SORGH_AS_0888]MDQ1131041.1 RND superfamily putative drug exporter [Microbacterium sp. SORGH_AS_0888]
MNALISAVTRKPRLTLGLWLAVLIAAAPLAIQLDGALSGGGFTNPRAEALVTQAKIQEQFGDEPNQFAIAITSESRVTDQEIQAAAQVLKDEGAASVITPETRPAWLSDDQKAALIVAGFDGSNTAAQNLTPRLQDRISDAVGNDASAYVTGQPALDYQLNVHSKEDATRAELIVFPLLLIILLVVFRSVVATILPLLMAGSALAVGSGIGYLLTRITDLSNLYSNIVSMIGLALAVDYSLFIIKRFREELATGADTNLAVRTAMSTAGHSVLFSGIAVVLALASLLIPNVMAFTSIALGGIIVTLAALAVTMIVLPAALLLLGRNIDKWQIPGRALARPRDPAPARVGTRFKIAGVSAVLAMVLAATPVLGLSLQSPVASATVLPANDTARQGLEVINQKIGADQLFPLQVVLEFGPDVSVAQALDAVSATAHHIEIQTGVASLTSVLDVGLNRDQLTAALDATTRPSELSKLWADNDGRIVTRILVETSQGPDSVQTHTLVTDLRNALPTVVGAGVTVGVAGATAQGVDFDNTIIDAIPPIALIVFTLTFILLAFAFRSFVLPTLALLFNALVVGASLGLLTLIQALTNHQPLNSVTPVLLFAVMFGLSMDYMVIIIARMIEAFQNGKPFEQAVLTGMRQTRSMVNSAAVVMIAVFLAFMTGQISIVREIGIGLALAVILDALVVRMLVMPALLSLIGPGAFGRRARLNNARNSGTTTAREPAGV